MPASSCPQNMMIPMRNDCSDFIHSAVVVATDVGLYFLLRPVRTAAGMSGLQSLTSHCFAAILACAASTVVFSSDMTSSGFSAPKMAVPATITLLPVHHTAFRLERLRAAHIGVGNAPASAHTSIVFGPTPPSTSMSFWGKRLRSSATLGTQRSMNFWPPRPARHRLAGQAACGQGSHRKRRTGIDSHDEEHVCCLAHLVCDRGRGCVGRDGDACLHLALVNGVDEGEGVRCGGLCAGYEWLCGAVYVHVASRWKQ